MSTANSDLTVGELLNALQQIKDLADAALRQGRRISSVPRKSRPRKIAKQTLAEHILDLRNGGFFKQAKTVGEIYSKIQTIYNCERNRVAMALLRLLKRKELRKASKVVDGEKEIAYVW